jgi:LEA14-like dessication related protein
MGVKLRIQNPNDKPVEFTGTALSLEVNGRELASGVSGETGTVPRYGETVLTVPVTISMMSMAKQALGVVSGGSLTAIPYKLHGKLEGGTFGTHRFNSEGKLDFSAIMPGS